jgi:hypothetical protein
MILSVRLIVAALVMFVTGRLMAWFPQIGFLLYGAGWLLVLQTLGVLFFRAPAMARNDRGAWGQAIDGVGQSAADGSNLRSLGCATAGRRKSAAGRADSPATIRKSGSVSVGKHGREVGNPRGGQVLARPGFCAILQ